MAPNGVAFIQTHQSWHCMTLPGISGVSPSEIWVIELLRAIAERERAEQGRHCIAADPMAPRHVIDNLSPSELSSCISIVSEALIWSHCGSFDASTRDDATPPILGGGSGPRCHRGHFAWSRHIDRAKVGWPRDLQIFHAFE
jgi:hypothetical protein